MRCISVLVLSIALTVSGLAQEEYQKRISAVAKTKGFVALWDFVVREDGRFAAHQNSKEKADLRLDFANYVVDYWGEGRPATAADFPLLGHGPFGEAVQFRAEKDPTFRPVLLVPRTRLHNSGIDAKGPGRSVTLLAWVVRQAGNHAIAGIWHEGTDLAANSKQAKRVETGMRQYALFAGLAANEGAAASHVSENGGPSYGDRYARNISVTPELIPTAAGQPRDEDWSLVGLRFDNRANTVTSFLNGKASEYWIDNPEAHKFFQWPAKGWREGTYAPQERKPSKREVLTESATGRVEVLTYEFTKVKVYLVPDEKGKLRRVAKRELVALKANPFWFDHDLFTPESAGRGGPFTIGRVIHSSRSVGFVGYVGAVAVFREALSSKEMLRLAGVARTPIPRPQSSH